MKVAALRLALGLLAAKGYALDNMFKISFMLVVSFFIHIFRSSFKKHSATQTRCLQARGQKMNTSQSQRDPGARCTDYRSFQEQGGSPLFVGHDSMREVTRVQIELQTNQLMPSSQGVLRRMPKCRNNEHRSVLSWRLL